MKLVEESLFAILTDNATVRRIIERRVYPDDVPQTVQGGKDLLPCVVYRLEAEERSETMCHTDDSVRAIVTTDCVALSRIDSNRLAQALIIALNRYSGQPSNGPYIKSIMLQDAFNIGDDVPGRLRRCLQWVIWYSQA